MNNMSKNTSEPCQVCGDIGFVDLIMTCFYCRDVREHTYCAKVHLMSPPDMWLCEVCRSSGRVLHVRGLVDKDTKDLTTDHGASGSKISGESSEKGSSSYTSPSKTNKPPFLAFPSPKRKRRTPRIPVDPEEADDQGPGVTPPSSK
ncbi:unnamed protein product [Brassica rapa subsp. trilocularis]